VLQNQPYFVLLLLFKMRIAEMETITNTQAAATMAKPIQVCGSKQQQVR
jgi:hypothetical protein